MAKGLKVIGCGGRDVKDYELIEAAVKASGFEIAELVSGAARGADSLFEKWAEKNKVKIKQFPANWNDITAPGAVVKERKNPWTKQMEKYNVSAGFQRNAEMAEYAQACIAVKGGAGTEDMIKQAKKKGLQVFVYEYEKVDADYDYKF